MKRIIMLAMLAVIALGCTKIPPGEVGVIVKQFGSERGVQAEPVTVGRVWYNPYSTDIIKYPTYMQNYVWTKSTTEGSKDNEEFSFQDKNGLPLQADIGVSYSVNPDKAPFIYEKYKKDLETITDIYIRNMIRNSLTKQTSLLDAEQIYSTEKSNIILNVTSDIQKELGSGFIIDKVYWIGNIRLPKAVEDAMYAKEQAKQLAVKAENEIAKTRADAEKARVEARGIADAQVIRAKANATALEIEGRAIRTNPSIIQLRTVEKWNGVLPQYSAVELPIKLVK